MFWCNRAVSYAAVGTRARFELAGPNLAISISGDEENLNKQISQIQTKYPYDGEGEIWIDDAIVHRVGRSMICWGPFLALCGTG